MSSFALDNPTSKAKALVIAFAAIAVLCSAAIGFVPKGFIDVYALVSDGRTMYEGGFHFLSEIPHAMVPAPIVCQEWGHSAIMAPLANLAGWNGIGAWGSVQAVALMLAMALFVSGTSPMRGLGRWAKATCSLAAGLLCILCCAPVLSARPIWLSAAVICCEATLVRSHMASPRWWKVVLACLCVMVESNFHASFVWLDFAVIGLFAFCHADGLPRRALQLLLCVPAALANPYGADAFFYLPNSMLLLQGMYIDELLPLLDPSSGIFDEGRMAAAAGCLMLLCGLAYCAIDRKDASMEQAALALASAVAIAAAMLAARNAWMPLVLCVPSSLVLFCGRRGGAGEVEVMSKLVSKMAFLPASLTIAIALSALSLVAASEQCDSGDFPITPTESEQAFFSEGGSIFFAQWLGGLMGLYDMDIAIDTRPEIWARAYLPGSETSFLEDYISMADYESTTPESIRDYLAKYRFEWVPVNGDSTAAKALEEYGGMLGYEIVDHDEDGSPVWRLSGE